MVLMAG